MPVCLCYKFFVADPDSFYINLPIGGVSGAIILLLFHTPKAALLASPVGLMEKLLQMDLVGTFVIMGAVVCYLLGVQWGGATKPWGSSHVIGTFVGFGILAIVFVIVEWRQGDRALLLPRILRQRTISVGCAFSFL